MPVPRADAGPRPLSARQTAHLDAQPAPRRPASTPANLLRRPLPSNPSAGAQQVLSKGEAQEGRHLKPGAATQERRKQKLRAQRAARAAAYLAKAEAKRRNRKRTDWPRVLMTGALGLLVLECAAAALFSPRLWVRQVVVEGNMTVPTEKLAAHLNLKPQTNLLRVPTGKLRVAVEAEPTVEKAEIRRRLPDTLRLIVTERRPWVSLKVRGGKDWYTIDRHLVPFRQTGAPEPGLPLIVADLGAEGAAATAALTLGKSVSHPGLAEAWRCLTWASEHGNEFPLEKVTIDAGGKLCLNRVGGVKVQLGSAMDLDKKLDTLDLLLSRRTDLRGSGASSVAAVNLVAYDAPALVAAAPSTVPAAAVPQSLP